MVVILYSSLTVSILLLFNKYHIQFVEGLALCHIEKTTRTRLPFAIKIYISMDIPLHRVLFSIYINFQYPVTTLYIMKLKIEKKVCKHRDIYHTCYVYIIYIYIYSGNF